MRKSLMVALACMALAGCSLPGSKSRPMDQYTLSPMVATHAAPANTCDAVLRVSAVQAVPPWSSDNLVYTETQYQVSTFAYHRWASPPASMLTDAIVHAVAGSGIYRGVLGPTDPGNGDLTLAVRLVRGPVQEFSGSGTSQTSAESLALAATLAETGSGRLVSAREFSGRESVAPNPYAGVVGANELSGRLVGQLVDWLAGASAGGLCQGGG